MAQSRLSTPQSVQSSVAPSTPDSAVAMNLQLSSQLEMTVKMQEETVRSFIVELKAQEQECEHWRKVVDEMRQRVKALQKDLWILWIIGDIFELSYLSFLAAAAVEAAARFTAAVSSLRRSRIIEAQGS